MCPRISVAPGVPVEHPADDDAHRVPAYLRGPRPHRAFQLGAAVEHLPAVGGRNAGVQVQRHGQFLQRGPDLVVRRFVEVVATEGVVDQRAALPVLIAGAGELTWGARLHGSSGPGNVESIEKCADSQVPADEECDVDQPLPAKGMLGSLVQGCIDGVLRRQSQSIRLG